MYQLKYWYWIPWFNTPQNRVTEYVYISTCEPQILYGLLKTVGQLLTNQSG